MVQAISNVDTQNVANVSKSNKKTNAFGDIFERLQDYNEKAKETVKESDETKELSESLQKALKGITVCKKCGSFYRGQTVEICSKCGNDIKNQDKTENSQEKFSEINENKNSTKTNTKNSNNQTKMTNSDLKS